MLLTPLQSEPTLIDKVHEHLVMGVVLGSEDHRQTAELRPIANAVRSGDARLAMVLACQLAYRTGELSARRMESTEEIAS